VLQLLMDIIGCLQFVFGVFDSETNKNWIWFMQMLRQAIGTPRGLDSPQMRRHVLARNGKFLVFLANMQ